MCSQDSAAPVTVFINGVLAGPLTAATLPQVLKVLRVVRSVRLRMKRSSRMLVIERFFKGRPQGEELFQHVMDNLFAMEDPEILDTHTMIGTATLPDWIMGGMLTSRIWIRDRDGKIITMRPLYNDDIDTQDRR